MEFDCVYGLELHRDDRVLSLKILSNRVASNQVLTPALLMPELAKQWSTHLRVSIALRMNGEGWSWAKLLSRMPALYYL